MKRGKKARKNPSAISYAGFIIRKRIYASGKIGWRLEIAKGKRGEREVFTYASEAMAKTEANKKAVEMLNRGNAAFDLTDRQRMEAIEALELLKGIASLPDAARCWLRYNRHADTGQTFTTLVQAYLADMVKRGLRPHTLNGARKRLSKMTRDMGLLPVMQITPADLEQWLDAQEAKAQNRRNYIAAVRACFNWGVKTGAMESNPAEKVELPQTGKDLPAIFNPATVAKIMQAAEQVAPECIGYLALCFFAGLRPMNEAGMATWENVDFDTGTLRVIPDVAKTRRARLVTIAPNLRDWLQRFRLANKGEQIAPVYWRLRRAMKEIMKKAGVTNWTPDIARHCFASAHLALHGDIQKTCLELGHTSPQMLFSHYRNLMSSTQATSYFAIKPSGKAESTERLAQNAERLA